MGAGCRRCANPVALERWWAGALGWVVLNDPATEFEIRPSTDRLPGLIFVPVPEAKQSKDRLPLDLRTDDQQAEVDQFLRMGARRVDIGQGSSPWVVLADPEGNEFDVLPASKNLNRNSALWLIRGGGRLRVAPDPHSAEDAFNERSILPLRMRSPVPARVHSEQWIGRSRPARLWFNSQ